MRANLKRKAMGVATASVLFAASALSTMHSTSMLASAFVGIDRSSSSRAQVETFQLFSNADDSDATTTTSILIQTVTDENMNTLLHPPSFPDRPVLVDAFAPWCGPVSRLLSGVCHSYSCFIFYTFHSTLFTLHSANSSTRSCARHSPTI